MKKKFILIAKCYESSLSGPANIVRGLVAGFQNKNIAITPILLKENTSKTVFLKTVIKEILRSRNATVNVHSDGFLIPFLVYLLSILNRNNSYYLTVHGIYEVEARIEGKGKLCYVLLERFLYKHFPNIICVSEMLGKDIQMQMKRRRKIYIIPNATNANSNVDLVYNRSSIMAISLGGLRKRKGIEEQIEMCTAMRAKNIPFVLNIYGSGEENRQAFQEKIKQMNLQDHIYYLGNLRDRQSVYDAVQSADVQLCLSKYDTFNVAIAESLALGCPCIATDRCGAASLIKHGYNGLIINISEEREQGYTQCIEYLEKLHNEPKMRYDIFQNRHEYQKKLSWENVIDQYANLDSMPYL